MTCELFQIFNVSPTFIHKIVDFFLFSSLTRAKKGKGDKREIGGKSTIDISKGIEFYLNEGRKMYVN